MKELAKLFQRLGAEDALNLDGGGSSIMLGRQVDGSLAVLNSPSDGHPRPVANGLEITYDASAPTT
jgi:exopolysaccharide biosynthesis protein